MSFAPLKQVPGQQPLPFQPVEETYKTARAELQQLDEIIQRLNGKLHVIFGEPLSTPMRRAGHIIRQMNPKTPITPVTSADDEDIYAGNKVSKSQATPAITRTTTTSSKIIGQHQSADTVIRSRE